MPAINTSNFVQEKRNRLLYWRYSFVGIYLGFYAWAALSYYLFMDALLAIILLTFSPVLAGPFVVYLLRALVIHAAESRPQRCWSVILGGVVAVGVFALLNVCWHSQLAIWKPIYASQLPSDRSQPRFAAWRWQDTSGPLQSFIYTLVYDDSGEIALPLKARSPAWRARAEQASVALNRPWRYVLDPSQQVRVKVEDKGTHFYMIIEHDG